MKTENRWEESFRETFIRKYFPPRIQEDLLTIESFSLPEIDFEKGEGLFLWGKAGSGKTLIASELLLQEKKRLWMNGGEDLNKEFKFVSASELLFEIKDSFNRDGVSKDGYTERFIVDWHSDVYFLVLDDMGVIAKNSNWTLNTFYLIINRRYEAQLPTIFTSNFDLNKLVELFDDRIASRIERMCRIMKKKPWDE